MCQVAVVAFAAIIGIGPTAVAEPPAPSDGPLGVEVADGLTLRDAAHGQDLACKVSYPEGDGPYPLIVFSHGFGASKDAFSTIARHWAGHGYVVTWHVRRPRSHRPHALRGRRVREPGPPAPRPGPRPHRRHAAAGRGRAAVAHGRGQPPAR